MTSIAELAAGVIHRTSEFGQNQHYSTGSTTEKPSSLAQIPMDTLLRLDAQGWRRIFVQYDVERETVQRLERLIFTWRPQSDYRILRNMATARRLEHASQATRDIIAEWVTYDDCDRLGHLVYGMRFTEPELPVCYAMSSAIRAIHSAVDYAREHRELTKEEIREARAELLESAGEYAELAGLGITDEPYE